mmetsp:Transcript_6278/g.11306  ORF Transcript_6278/g.11306 Transcript_6278/m.11306 type:complete len:110 (+) Transcript_6278:60-389(+)
MAAFIGTFCSISKAAFMGSQVCSVKPQAAVAAAPKTGAASLNMVTVHVNDGEPVEAALRRFKREVMKSGHLLELRNRRYYEPPSLKKQRFNASIKRKKEINKLLRGLEQ